MSADPFARFRAAQPSTAATATTATPRGTGDMATADSSSVSDSDAMVLMIDLVWRDGRRLALPYALVEAVAYDGKGCITIECGDRSVRLEGLRLIPLYLGLSTHRVYRIIETSDGFATDGTSPLVRSVAIHAAGRTADGMDG